MTRPNSLFSKGWMTRQPSLSDVLDHHRNQMADRIRAVTDLDQLTDAFLTGLVKEALVEPLQLHFDRMTRKDRTEEMDGSQFPDPFSFNVRPGHTYKKLVSRISVPFTGDKLLLEHTPNSCTTVFPHGDVYGQSVQFDVTFWGYSDDNERVRKQIEENLRLLEMYAGNTNKQVSEFNSGLADALKPVFETKLEQLTNQLSVFDSLGIKQEEPAPSWTTTTTPAPRGRKSSSRPPAQIIQYIQSQFVEQLTQINRNTGDVTNAIQSS